MANSGFSFFGATRVNLAQLCSQAHNVFARDMCVNVWCGGTHKSAMHDSEAVEQRIHY
jgi:hypothetical protein